MYVEVLLGGSIIFACPDHFVGLFVLCSNWRLRVHVFLIYLLRNPINVCWNPQNSARFSRTIDLRGHMPRFTLKMNVFPSISSKMPWMCVEILRTVLVFPRWSIWGVTCLGLLEKWMFSHLSSQKPHKCVFRPSEQCSFSKMIDLRCHMPRFTLKMNVFPSISLETPKMSVETLRTVLVFRRWSIWGSHA